MEFTQSAFGYSHAGFRTSTQPTLCIESQLFTCVSAMGYVIYFKSIFIEPLAVNIPDNWLFGISPEGIGSIGMMLNFFVASLVASVTPAPPEDVQQLVENIRIPKNAQAASIH